MERQPAPDVGDPEAWVGRQVGPYQITALIAIGKRGCVYKARHDVMGREVAVKVLRSEFEAEDKMVERFRREIRIGSTLKHPNIIDFYDAGTHEGHIYLVMEYFPGFTLTQRFLGKPAPARVVSEIGLQMAAALAAAHARDVVHREIEPDNVLVDDAGRVKVLDFGMAKAYQEIQPRALTDPYELVGNPSFMAPEQAFSADRITRRADIYSVGAVLYFCLTGRPPYTGSEPMEIVQKIGQPVLPPSEVRPGTPPELEAVILRAMHRDPDQRHADASALEADFARSRASAFVSEGPLVDESALEDDSSATYDPDAVADARAGDRVAELPADAVVPYLRIFGPAEGCWEYQLSRKEISIGRGEDCNLPLVESSVSRHHASISCAGESYYVRDCDSRAGTYVNGRKIGRQLLVHGDTIQIAHYVLQFRRDERYVSARGKAFPLHFLPSSMQARYRLVNHPPQKVFTTGDTLPVAHGGIFVPVPAIPPEDILVEVELTWPGGKRKCFLAEILGTVPHDKQMLMCLKLHQVDRASYDDIVRRSQRGEWIQPKSM